MTRVTLQGGVHDSRSIEVEELLPFIKIADPVLVKPQPFLQRIPDKFPVSVYRKQIMRSGSVEWVVYVFDHHE